MKSRPQPQNTRPQNSIEKNKHIKIATKEQVEVLLKKGMKEFSRTIKALSIR